MSDELERTAREIAEVCKGSIASDTLLALLDRAERAEAEVERLREALEEIATWPVSSGGSGPLDALNGIEARARAALTPYNAGDPEPARVSPVPDTREEGTEQ